MASIPLTQIAIESYIGGGRFNACQAIKYIHVQYDIERNLANIEAHIPASTTNQGDYKISVQLETDRGSIRRASCNCPIGHKCKQKSFTGLKNQTSTPFLVLVSSLRNGMHAVNDWPTRCNILPSSSPLQVDLKWIVEVTMITPCIFERISINILGVFSAGKAAQ